MTIVVFIFALAGYLYVLYNLVAFCMLMSMDSGLTVGSAIMWVVVLSLWFAGLYFGTMAYF